MSGQPRVFEVLERRPHLAATLFADIVPGPTGSGPNELNVADGTLYFTKNQQRDQAAYRGLWKTDGTAAGTAVQQGTGSGILAGERDDETLDAR